MKHINDKGFSLVETIIAMAIFVIVIMVTGASFKTVMNSASLVNKSEESNIEGVVGLEMFRHDIAQAGFGLPDSFLNSSISYNEAQYLPASAYNDAQFTVPYTPVAQYYVPRAIVGGNDLLTNLSDPNSYNGVTYSVMPGTDYLALKGTTLGTTPAAQNWTYARYSSSGGIIRQPWPAANLNPSDQVLVINRTFPTSPGPSNQLVNPAHQSYWMPYPNSASLVGSNYSPTQAGQYFYLYGVQSNNPVNNNLGMPFNRADYFVATPSDNSLPSSCAKGTGILYKAIVNHSDGKLTYLPIMDCVADMQVVLGWNLGDSSGNLVSNDFSTGSGLIDTWSSANGLPYSTTLSAPMAADYVQHTILTDPAHIRTKLKLIKVYILAQVGHLDPNYTNSSSLIQMFEPGQPEQSLVRQQLTPTPGYYNLASNPKMLNYRWKVYRLVVKPNLISNQ